MRANPDQRLATASRISISNASLRVGAGSTTGLATSFFRKVKHSVRESGPGFAKKMEKADDIMRRYRNALRVLAQ